MLKGKTKYTPNSGIKELRDALSEKLWRENKIKCNPDKNLIVTGGATQALMLAMVTLVNPGDEVILPGPSWPDYAGQIRMVNAIPVYVEVSEEHEFKMTADLILEKTHVVTAPGSTFGPGGEGFLRLCYANSYEDLREALERMRKVFGTK